MIFFLIKNINLSKILRKSKKGTNSLEQVSKLIKGYLQPLGLLPKEIFKFFFKVKEFYEEQKLQSKT